MCVFLFLLFFCVCAQHTQDDVSYIVGLLRNAPVDFVTSESRTVTMTSTLGRKFTCVIPPTNPNINKTVPGNEEDVKELSHEELTGLYVKGIKKALGKQCFTKTVDYWTYQVCPWSAVTQYHLEGSNKGMEFQLGGYDPTVSPEILLTDSTFVGLKQRYSGGTDGRETTVHYQCNLDTEDTTVEPKRDLSNADVSSVVQASPVKKEPAQQHYIFRVSEPTMAKYEITLKTTAACVKATSKPTLPLILHPLIGEPCQYFNAGWWTYKYCHMTGVSQYHVENVPDESASVPGQPIKTKVVQTASFDLGSVTTGEFALRQGATWDLTYASLNYTGGTPCDLGFAHGRRTEVRFYCNPDELFAFTNYKEVATCEYAITIGTRLLCKHDPFKPSIPESKEIICVPLDSSSTPSSGDASPFPTQSTAQTELSLPEVTPQSTQDSAPKAPEVEKQEIQN